MRYPYQNSFVANDYYLLVSHTPASYPYVTPEQENKEFHFQVQFAVFTS